MNASIIRHDQNRWRVARDYLLEKWTPEPDGTRLYHTPFALAYDQEIANLGVPCYRTGSLRCTLFSRAMLVLLGEVVTRINDHGMYQRVGEYVVLCNWPS